MSFLTAIVDFDYPDNETERKIIESAGGSLISAHLTDPDDIVEFARDADAIISQYAIISKDVMSRLPKLKVVGRYGIGIDNVDVKGAEELGIYAVNNPRYCIDEVSDHAVAMIMTQHRQIAHGTDQVKSGVWDFTKLTPIKASRDTVIGIVGFGNIGRRTAEKLKAIGFKCIAVDPYVDESVFRELGVEKKSLEELVKLSDCVTIHCSLNDETLNMFDAKILSMMKPGSYLVNTSRGPVIDIEALLKELNSGKIRGAALDVLANEPPNSFTDLAETPALLLTPHLAFYSDSSIVELRTSIAEQVVEVMEGKVPRYNCW